MAGTPEEPARCGKCFLLVNSSHKISLNVWHLSIHFFISFLAFLYPYFNCRLHETGKQRASPTNTAAECYRCKTTLRAARCSRPTPLGRDRGGAATSLVRAARGPVNEHGKNRAERDRLSAGQPDRARHPAGCESKCRGYITGVPVTLCV